LPASTLATRQWLDDGAALNGLTNANKAPGAVVLLNRRYEVANDFDSGSDGKS